jgi:glycosyltransferase involved in cell wall biosynthesis
MSLLTVVLLTYNHEPTIGRAFDSILEQRTDFDFVIYVLEDCSTDGTAAICKSYKDRFPEKITLFLNEKNLGVTNNIKQGLLKVKSKYYAFLEGDDYWCHAEKLQKQVDAMENFPGCIMCGHNTLFRDLVTHKDWLFVERDMEDRRNIYSLEENLPIHLSARLYRNCIDLTDVPAYMLLDKTSYMLYLTKGNLFYIDEVMSVYNKTGEGYWSARSRKKRRLMSLHLRYGINKYFNFTYEGEYYQNSKLLKCTKSLLGTKLGWKVFFYLESFRLHAKYLF